MKILVIDGDDVGLDFCLRSKWNGHRVKLFKFPGKFTKTGEGLIDIVQDWREWMDWADLIFMTDNSHYMRELDKYFERGYPIFGTNMKSARLETDRMFGMEVMEKCGIDVPVYKQFSDFGSAIEYVLKDPKKRLS